MVISISLVLLLVGIAVLLLVNAKAVTDYFKENLTVSVILKDNVSDDGAEAFCASLQKRPFVKNATLITRAQGLEEMSEVLGTDFLEVFSTTPVPVSVDVSVAADYVSSESLEQVKETLLSCPEVDEVVYRTGLVETLNSNLRKISIILGTLIVLLMFISFVLIGNTVRLNLFSRRFTIHAMRLVGATRGFIRRPFTGRAVLQGPVASALAIGMLSVLLLLLHREIPQLFEVIGQKMLIPAFSAVVVCGVVICTLSTAIVVNNLVGLQKDELYA